MSITATLDIPAEKSLQALLSTEAETFKHKRATYTLKTGEKLTITITAEDATALKATVSSICRVLTVHEKAQ